MFKNMRIRKRIFVILALVYIVSLAGVVGSGYYLLNEDTKREAAEKTTMFLRTMNANQVYMKKFVRDKLADLTDDAVDAIADIAAEINTSAENIGARRLHTVLERLLEELSFDAPEKAGETIHVTPEMVQERLGELLGNQDLARYIL